MKDFLKFVLATITGIIAVSILFFLFGIVMLFGMLYSTESETKVKENSIMMLNLDGTLSQRSQDNLFNFLTGERNNESYGLDDILSAIGKAKTNDDIKGIYIQATALEAGFASLKEIRDALLDFKETGKFIVAYSDAYTQGLYYLSSVADKILLNPYGMLEWKGLASSPIFIKDLLDKVGIETEIFRVGTYKSAIEMFTSKEMSEASREQEYAFVSSIWEQIKNDVAESRRLTVEELDKAADRMMDFRPATEYIEYGLADTLIYKNDVRDYLKQMVGVDNEDDINVLSLKQMINIKKNVPKDKSGNLIAIYYADGNIDMDSGMDSGIESQKVIRDLRKLQDNKDVKAVVLRVNSPGGSAYGSEQIWYAMNELKKEKPVIVSMGDYAASGGYYISCSADTIVAEPTTMTGSIGIFGILPNIKKLTDKIGIDFDVVKTNDYADFSMMMTRPMNEGEKGLMQMYVNRGYDLFISRCAEGRGLDKEEIDKIAQGRIWTGTMAKELGLVDVLGGLDKAIEIAAEKAGVQSYTIINQPDKESILESLIKTTQGDYIKARLLKGSMGELYHLFHTIDGMDNCDRIQAIMPFIPNIR